MNTNKLLKLIISAAMIGFSGLMLHGQMGGDGHDHGEKSTDGSAMMEHCRDMMEQMQERNRQMDQELNALIHAMEESEGEEKIQAMQEAIRTLAEQRLKMHEHHQHMMLGDEEARGAMMMQCPMMQPTESADEQAVSEEPDHEEHH